MDFAERAEMVFAFHRAWFYSVSQVGKHCAAVIMRWEDCSDCAWRSITNIASFVLVVNLWESTPLCLFSIFISTWWKNGKHAQDRAQAEGHDHASMKTMDVSQGWMSRTQNYSFSLLTMGKAPPGILLVGTTSYWTYRWAKGHLKSSDGRCSWYVPQVKWT